VISDLHMGDGTAKDNFREYRNRLETFLDYVAGQGNSRLILAGDVFEFWQCSHGAIIREYLDVLKRLLDMNAAIIVGNHDIDLNGFVGINLDTQFFRALCKNVTVKASSRNITVCHGHEFDEYNNPKRSLFIGRISAILAGEAEMRVGTEVGGVPTEKLLLRLVRWIGQSFLKIYRKLHKTPAEAGEKKQNKYKTALDQYKENHPETDVLIAGHTHKPGTYGGWYYNTGSWQQDLATYVRITPDGDVSLYRWPSGEIYENALWSESGQAKSRRS